MNLKNITVTEITNVFTVYSEKGKCDKMVNRRSYGLALCCEVMTPPSRSALLSATETEP